MIRADFDNFVARLRHHNKGVGVNDHGTANPIFIVQKRERVTGFDSAYVDDYFWVDFDRDHHVADERTAKRLDALDDAGRSFGRWEKVYYADRWEYVCAHLTREAAEAFIARKGHDYAELRIMVDSQCWCLEFNDLIAGLLSGQIAFNG